MWICRLGWYFSTTFSSCISAVLAQRVFEGMDRTRWTNCMACSLPWFKSLRFLCPESSEVYCLCYRREWRPRTGNSEYRMDLESFVRHPEFSSESGSLWSDMRRPAWKVKMDTLSILLNFQKAGARTLCLRRPGFIEYFFLCCGVRHWLQVWPCSFRSHCILVFAETNLLQTNS